MVHKFTKRCALKKINRLKYWKVMNGFRGKGYERLRRSQIYADFFFAFQSRICDHQRHFSASRDFAIRGKFLITESFLNSLYERDCFPFP